MENWEKRKEELDEKLEQYGGLWHSKIQMDGCLAALPVELHKDVLTTQIRYRKQILGNKPKEQTLLQVQSGKDHFSTEKLKENLELFLTQLQNKGNEGQRKKGTLKRQAEQEELVQDIVQKKKESNQKCVPVKKRMRVDLPELVGKTILHKWQDGH